jgi:hypothetical protein
LTWSTTSGKYGASTATAYFSIRDGRKFDSVWSWRRVVVGLEFFVDTPGRKEGGRGLPGRVLGRKTPHVRRPKKPTSRIFCKISLIWLDIKVVNNWRTALVRIGVFVAVALLTFSLIISTILSKTHLQSAVDREHIGQAALNADALQKMLASDQAAFERDIDAEIRNLQKGQNGNGGMSLPGRAALAQVVEGQKQLSARLGALEGALMNEPAKALAVPLLKKDVDDVLDREQKDAAAVRAQDDRLDRLMSQVLTTTFAVLVFFLSCIGFVFSLRKTATVSK